MPSKCGFAPAAIWSDDRFSLFWTPAAALVWANLGVVFQDRIDDRPGSFHGILTCEKRSIAGHGIAQKPLVGRFVFRTLFQQVGLSLFPDELISLGP